MLYDSLATTELSGKLAVISVTAAGQNLVEVSDSLVLGLQRMAHKVCLLVDLPVLWLVGARSWDLATLTHGHSAVLLLVLRLLFLQQPHPLSVTQVVGRFQLDFLVVSCRYLVWPLLGFGRLFPAQRILLLLRHRHFPNTFTFKFLLLMNVSLFLLKLD